MSQEEKFLKVVYYLDANKARHFTISRPRLYFFVLSMLVMSLWTVTSVFAIAALLKSKAPAVDVVRSHFCESLPKPSKH